MCHQFSGEEIYYMDLTTEAVVQDLQNLQVPDDFRTDTPTIATLALAVPNKTPKGLSVKLLRKQQDPRSNMLITMTSVANRRGVLLHSRTTVKVVYQPISCSSVGHL